MPLAALPCLSLCGLLTSVCRAEPSHRRASASDPEVWTVDDLLASPSPYALGHRGYGVSTCADPTRPIESRVRWGPTGPGAMSSPSGATSAPACTWSASATSGVRREPRSWSRAEHAVGELP